MDSQIDQMIQRCDICPVLVDVGASGHPPAIWRPIAPQSVYVGFDPDEREMRDEAEGLFKRSVIVNKAVTADPSRDAVDFYYTHSPFCSSTLPPDGESLADYLFADLFEVEREGVAPATTLEAVRRQLKLASIDWLKVDSQGTDLRILNSLPDAVRRGVLAVDIEPGLIDAYIGEDTFIDVHRDLTNQGFWLSDMSVLGSVRIGRDSVRAARIASPNMDPDCISQTCRTSPGWCEARYLRSADWLARHEADRRQYALGWVFAMLDEQYGHAIDLAVQYAAAFGEDDSSRQMVRTPVAILRRIDRHQHYLRARSYPIDLLRRVARRVRVAAAAAF